MDARIETNERRLDCRPHSMGDDGTLIEDSGRSPTDLTQTGDRYYKIKSATLKVVCDRRLAFCLLYKGTSYYLVNIYIYLLYSMIHRVIPIIYYDTRELPLNNLGP